jgi:hypothetical protein
MENFTNASIFATKDTLYTTINPLFLSYIDKRIQMLLTVLLPYGNIYFKTDLQKVERTIQVTTMIKYLYHTMKFDFNNIVKYSQTNHRVLKKYLTTGILEKTKSSEVSSAVNRLEKNKNLLKDYADMINLYQWKNSAYELYKELIFTNDKYFYKLLETKDKILGYAWNFSIQSSGPIEFLTENVSVLKSLKIEENSFTVSNNFVVNDDFSKNTYYEIQKQLVSYQNKFFTKLGVDLSI